MKNFIAALKGAFSDTLGETRPISKAADLKPLQNDKRPIAFGVVSSPGVDPSRTQQDECRAVPHSEEEDIIKEAILDAIRYGVIRGAEYRLSHGQVRAIVDSPPVINVYASCEFDELSEDGQVWLVAIANEVLARYGNIGGSAVRDGR